MPESRLTALPCKAQAQFLGSAGKSNQESEEATSQDKFAIRNKNKKRSAALQEMAPVIQGNEGCTVLAKSNKEHERNLDCCETGYLYFSDCSTVVALIGLGPAAPQSRQSDAVPSTPKTRPA